jgi:hypothetical protein
MSDSEKFTKISENFHIAINALAKVVVEMECYEVLNSSSEEVKKTIGDLVVADEIVSYLIEPISESNE